MASSLCLIGVQTLSFSNQGWPGMSLNVFELYCIYLADACLCNPSGCCSGKTLLKTCAPKLVGLSEICRKYFCDVYKWSAMIFFAWEKVSLGDLSSAYVLYLHAPLPQWERMTSSKSQSDKMLWQGAVCRLGVCVSDHVSPTQLVDNCRKSSNSPSYLVLPWWCSTRELEQGRRAEEQNCCRESFCPTEKVWIHMDPRSACLNSAAETMIEGQVKKESSTNRLPFCFNGCTWEHLRQRFASKKCQVDMSMPAMLSKPPQYLKRPSEEREAAGSRYIPWLRLQIEAWDRCSHITFGCGFATLNTTRRESHKQEFNINAPDLSIQCIFWHLHGFLLNLDGFQLDVSLLPEIALEQCVEDTGPLISSSGPWYEALESNIIGICMN